MVKNSKNKIKKVLPKDEIFKISKHQSPLSIDNLFVVKF